MSAKESKEEVGKSAHLSFTPYAWAAVGLLIVLCLAILTPDILNHTYRLRALKQAAQGNANASNQTNAGTSSKTNAAPNLAAAVVDVPIKTADLFEVYAKLITLLLSFVSVLGVFFGYFVRRSLREVEEDVRGDVERRVGLWEKEKDALLKSNADEIQKVHKELDGFVKAKAEAERLVVVLGQVEKLEADKKSVGPSSKDATKAINSDPTIESPPQ